MRWKKRLIAILTLVGLLIIILPSVVLAGFDPNQLYRDQTASTTATNGEESASAGGILNNQEINSFYADSKNKPTFSEGLMAGVVIGPVKTLMELTHLSDPILLVFGKGTSGSTDTFLKEGIYGTSGRDNLVLSIFPQPFFQAVSILYTAFENLLPIPLVMALVIFAILHMINSGTVEGRSKIKDYIRAFVVAIAALRFGHYLWYWFISLNNFLIDLIWEAMINHGIKPGFFMDMIWGTGHSGFEKAANTGSLTMAILMFLAVIMILVLNYQYTLRMIILGLLIMIFPIAAVLSIFPTHRNTLTSWMQEFVANVTIPLAHALALGGFFLTLSIPGINTGLAFWLLITYFAGLPAIVGMIRQLVGLEHGSGALRFAGAMMGLGAVTNMGRMLMSSGKQSGKNAGAGNELIEGNVGASANVLSGGSGSGSSGASFVGRGLQTAGRFANSGFVRGTAKLGLGVAAGAAGAAISTMTTGNPTAGMTMGMGATALAAKGVGHAASGISNLTQGTPGGVLASAGWGLQSAVNKISSAAGHGEIFAAPSFIQENKAMLRNAHQGLAELKPQVDLAYAKHEHALNHFGPEAQETKEAYENYASLKGIMDTHRADALLAQTRMKSRDELQKYAASYKENWAYSRSGGRI